MLSHEPIIAANGPPGKELIPPWGRPAVSKSRSWSGFSLWAMSMLARASCGCCVEAACVNKGYDALPMRCPVTRSRLQIVNLSLPQDRLYGVDSTESTLFVRPRIEIRCDLQTIPASQVVDLVGQINRLTAWDRYACTMHPLRAVDMHIQTILAAIVCAVQYID